MEIVGIVMIVLGFSVLNIFFSSAIADYFRNTNKWLIRATLIPPIGLLVGAICICVIVCMMIRQLVTDVWY
jgi:uncharacterized membrane protein required for colicin V production